MNVDIIKDSRDNSWFSLSIDDCLDVVLARYAKESRREVFLDDSTIEEIERLNKEGLTYEEIMDTLDIKMHLVRRVLGVARNGETNKEKYTQKQLHKGETDPIEENRKKLKQHMCKVFSPKRIKKMLKH